MEQAEAVGGDVLVVAGAEAEAPGRLVQHPPGRAAPNAAAGFVTGTGPARKGP